MLVLSRKIGERVLIGESIVVTVLEVRGQVVKVGIEAPRTIRVFREELALDSFCPPGDSADSESTRQSTKKNQ